jgi:molybdenum cofactor synthesis domain-containing protein
MGGKPMSAMTPFKLLTSYEKALTIIQKTLRPIDRIESIPIETAHDRLLAKDLLADISVPPFRRAAMDGYAVKAKETFHASTTEPKRLKLVDKIHAGDSTDRSLKSKECIQVATGSPLPKNADAVVMVEYTSFQGGVVNIFRPVYPGSNISPKGEDIEKGTMVLKKNDLLIPAKIGVLAALGYTHIEVYAKPQVIVISTGSEVRKIGSKLESGQIYDVNSYTISAILKENGAIPVPHSPVKDNHEEIKSVIANSLDYELIVISGGSSVGERDLLSHVVEEMGKIIFHGVQVKPGKPTLFGIIDETPIFGMPGYPTSCLSNSYHFLKPAVRLIARLPPHEMRRIKAKLSQRVVSTSGRLQFLPVNVSDGIAQPVFKTSGAITSMSNANGYLVLPINLDVIEEGQEVTVYLLR